MADIVDRATRSRMMSGIKGKNTKPEHIVRKYLYRNGIGFTLHNKDLPGRPDITLSKYRTVVFVHGCFWHQHDGCPLCTFPKSNREFWQTKLEGNVNRDERHRVALEKLGWRVITMWECEVTNEDNLARLIATIRG